MAQFKRSRLERKEDETVTKRTVFLGLLTIAAVVLILVFGLPLLIKFSVFLGQSKDNIVEEEKVLPPLPPRLIVPFEATNSARISISGLAEPGVEVELLKNDVAVDKTVVSEEGDFVFRYVDLSEGENVFTAVAVSQQGGSSELSQVVKVVFDNQPPAVEMLNPKEEKLTVDYDDFDVTGRSEPGVSVLINNRVAMVDNDGFFKLKIQLQMGKNEIEVKVRDMAGNETIKKIEINYDI